MCLSASYGRVSNQADITKSPVWTSSGNNVHGTKDVTLFCSLWQAGKDRSTLQSSYNTELLPPHIPESFIPTQLSQRFSHLPFPKTQRLQSQILLIPYSLSFHSQILKPFLIYPFRAAHVFPRLLRRYRPTSPSPTSPQTAFRHSPSSFLL